MPRRSHEHDHVAARRETERHLFLIPDRRHRHVYHGDLAQKLLLARLFENAIRQLALARFPRMAKDGDLIGFPLCLLMRPGSDQGVDERRSHRPIVTRHQDLQWLLYLEKCLSDDLGVARRCSEPGQKLRQPLDQGFLPSYYCPLTFIEDSHSTHSSLSPILLHTLESTHPIRGSYITWFHRPNATLVSVHGKSFFSPRPFITENFVGN